MVKKPVKICFNCGGNMTVYPREIRKSQLILLRKLGFEFVGQYKKGVELNPLANGVADFTKLKYWGLIEENKLKKSYYRITDLGARFIRGMVAIPKFKWVYKKNIQPDPIDKENPLIYCWDVKWKEISKEIVLRDAEMYPYKPTTQQSFI